MMKPRDISPTSLASSLMPTPCSTAEDSAVVQAAFGNTSYRRARERQSDGKFVDYSFEDMLKDIGSGRY